MPCEYRLINGKIVEMCGEGLGDLNTNPCGVLAQW